MTRYWCSTFVHELAKGDIVTYSGVGAIVKWECRSYELQSSGTIGTGDRAWVTTCTFCTFLEGAANVLKRL